jgi:hypothetical protein
VDGKENYGFRNYRFFLSRLTAAATRRPPDSRKDEGFCDRRPTAHVAELNNYRLTPVGS